MTWLPLAQAIAVLLNLASLVFNLQSSKRTRKTYMKIADDAIKEMYKQSNEYANNINQLAKLYDEEIELLKTNEGLYDLRNNEEQYQMYLHLLRKK